MNPKLLICDENGVCRGEPLGDHDIRVRESTQGPIIECTSEDLRWLGERLIWWSDRPHQPQSAHYAGHTWTGD